MFGYGQCLRYPQFFYFFTKFLGFVFIIFFAGCPAKKVLRQYIAASFQRGLKMFLPTLFTIKVDMLIDLIGYNISCCHEGAGRLDKVTVKGDEAQIETIQDGLAEPVSVTQVGNTGWVAEGKLSYIIGDNKGKDPGPFVLKPVTLSK